PETTRLALAACGCFCAGGLYGWSALIEAIQGPLGVSTAQIGLIFSWAVISFSTAVLVAPLLPISLTGLRGSAWLGIFGALCLMAAAMAPDYLSFVLAFSLGFGSASGAIYINALTLAAQSARPALMTPVMVAAFGLGGAAFGPLWRVLVAQGWGLWGLLVLAGTLALTSALSFLPGPRSVTVDDAPAAIEDSRPVPLLHFFLIWAIFALSAVGGLMVLGLAAKILDHAGSSVLLASIALGGIAVGNTVGRLSVAAVNAALSPLGATIGATLLTSVGLAITTLSPSATGAAMGLCLTGLGYGATASAIPSLTGQLYGRTRFFRAFAMIFTAWGVAGLVGPWAAGAIFDRTGQFAPALSAALAATLTATALALFLRHRVR
ncbi:MAG: hypothetical protein AAF245_10285, partial [Pseudomonadota bacterium]